MTGWCIHTHCTSSPGALQNPPPPVTGRRRLHNKSVPDPRIGYKMMKLLYYFYTARLLHMEPVGASPSRAAQRREEAA